ncbi:coiled-coil domain-containing protein 170-like isoform 1-T6 [Dama dama]|uniref:coiled-coil domain-containing protein 170-like isoform X1 n=2 Tax=Dama dama TaxID=30532 RepID=UPI002A368A81|nr:coiled-coil domain-containing protein 170-like isoform X1 [Dama dama]XP_061012875.1 coiled-coil domain-containing protein 170-like isoform X1 [Dama dama]XP_061012876.1 coiled-coil domain-containing protein 170-like isoform X1 [Dama dama]XP_061012877.1 coiled-coil domain-containing protein 170-like isoform X1 [Dama dama]XP_061012878.1 coiled-coil domain-containing protein 170-like isoform X1 [Dama dama]
MSSPFQFLSHSNPGKLANAQSKGPRKAKPLEVKKNLSAYTSRKNSSGACLNPPLEVVPTRNPVKCTKTATDSVHPDLAGLLVKNKNLLAELRNLRNKLFIKETSLQEMKSELETYKENNVQQSFQIMSLKDDIKDLEELTASLTRIKSLKNTSIQSLERGNWDLTERITELENLLRVHLIERKRAEQKADLLEKKLAGANRFTPYMSMKEQEDSLDSFMTKDKDEAILFERDNTFRSEGPKDGQKIWDKCQQDLIHKEKQIPELDRPTHSYNWETKTARSNYQKFLSQLSALPSNSVEPTPAIEEAVKERILETGANEQSWKSRAEVLQQEIQMLTKRLEKQSHHSEETARELSNTEKKYMGQKRPLKCLEGKIAINDLFQGKLDLDMNKIFQVDKHGIAFKQLEKDNKQETLLNIQQNFQTVTTQRLEEKIQKLQKQLSDLKLSNKNMKSQLTRVNILKDKTIEKLRESLTKVEAMKGKAAMETDLNITVDSDEQEARWGKKKVHQMLETATPELSTAKSTLEEVPGKQEELVDFRETIMKMLGFNMKTADKKIINHLRLIIQVYEASDKSKMASERETGQDNE